MNSSKPYYLIRTTEKKNEDDFNVGTSRDLSLLCVIDMFVGTGRDLSLPDYQRNEGSE
jgi:hypothetical protein